MTKKPKEPLPWTAENVQKFKNEYAKLVNKYGMDHKIKLVSDRYFLFGNIHTLVNKEIIKAVVHIVRPEDSSSAGTYVNNAKSDD